MALRAQDNQLFELFELGKANRTSDTCHTNASDSWAIENEFITKWIIQQQSVITRILKNSRMHHIRTLKYE